MAKLEIKLAVHPPNNVLKVGKAKLDVRSGVDNIKIWTDQNRTTEVKSGDDWDIASMPETLYVEGIKACDNMCDVSIALEYSRGSFTCDDLIKMTVIKVDFVDVHATDTDTHKIPAASGATHDDHFVCVKGTGDVILNATVSPNESAVLDQLVWEADGVTITYPAVGTNMRTAKLSSLSSARIPVCIKVGGSTCWEGVVWVVWSSIVSASIPFNEDITPTYGIVKGGYVFTATITPEEIITDADRPALHGAKTSGPPGGTNVCGNSLAGGADKHWDISRQTRQKVVDKPAGWQDVDWLPPPCWYTGVLNYPVNDVVGNDDTGTGDEDNDPYTAPELKKLESIDQPVSGARHSSANLNDTLELRVHFREFTRLELDSKWYRISDFFEWRFHQHLKKVNISEAEVGVDLNSDGDTLDTVPGWRDNGSFLDTSNNGW